MASYTGLERSFAMTQMPRSGESVRKAVESHAADIGMAGVYVTQSRLAYIDMSVGHSKDCAAFITLASKALPKYRAILGPFQWQVWIAVIIVYFVAIVPLSFSDKMTFAHLSNNIGEIENMFWYVFGTFTNSLTFVGKYSWSYSQKISTRLIIGSYWIFTIIITSCYTGSIIAFVTLPVFPTTVDSVYDLLGLFYRVGTLVRATRAVAKMDPEAVKLLQQQKRFGSYISNFSTNCTKSKPAAQFTLADVEHRMQLLEEYWKDYTKRDDNLQDFAEALADDNYFKEDDYTTTSNRYLDAKHWLANRRQEIQAASPKAVAHNGPSGQQVVQPRVSLEAIKLPHFTGAQKEWDSFKEKFMSLVVLDTSINVVCKFIRLTNCLSGPALKKLSGITSFNPAWEALCKRYDNHRLRFSTHMKAVIQLPSSKQESTTHLNQLLNTVSEAVTTFTTLNRAVAEWDDILVYLVESKLAPETTKDWVKVIETREVDQFPTYAELKKFLETRVRTLDMIVAGDSSLFHERDSSLCQNSKQRQSQSGSGDSLNHKKSSHAKRTAVYVATQPGSQTGVTKCTLCEGGHLLSHCKEFQALPTTQRKEHVVKARLCYNCLSPKHMTNACTSQNRCYVCNGKHHTRLHLDSKGTPTAVNTCTTSGPMSASTEEPSPSCYTVSASRTILLSTACVTLCSDQGHAITVRALLDSGSEESFISEHVAQALGVKRKAVNVAVSGVGGETNAVARSRVLVTLKSQHDIEYTRSVPALVLTRLTAILPRQQISMQKWPHLQGLFLADPTFGTPGRIDCILNSAVYAGALRPGLKKGVEGAPVALAFVFGWLIMGSAGASDSMTQPQIGIYHICIDHELSEALSRFWEVEEDTREKPLSPEDQWCYDHFKQTHSRNEEGRFVVKLPFKELPQLQDTRATATSCLQRTERRFIHKPEVEASYKTFMEEYRSLGHMELKKNQRDSTDNFSCYLTHHAVFKNDKIRVVFNASLKDRCGKSLNSYLHIGPKLQENIVVIIMRWMFLRYAFTCDIVKMFRQILVHQDDVKWQRILWRDSADLPIDHYSLLTVTYGMASAPFLANSCMLCLADDENHRFPLAATVLRKYRYADDFFTGGGTIEEATQVRDELIKMLASAGMEVGKWAANHVNLLNNIDKVAEKQTVIQEDNVVSTLGLHWSPAEDAFIFKITPVEPAKTVTKRAILSEIARLFDPIGWLAPIIILAKILMQNLWLQGIDWDAPVPTTTEHAWQLFKEQLKDIEDIRIPRWLGTTQDSTWQLHCFCDASERAFATVLYLRVTNGNSCHTRLIAAKSRVAPVKVMSLPRLELEGAVLMVHLISAVTPKLESTPISIHCWSDSQVVLAWLKAHPSRWKTAVANRVSEIISLLPTAIWNHIRSAHNPADLATRGVTPNQLRDSQLWLEGPPWLLQGESAWPSNSEDEVTTLEAKGTASSQVFTAQVEEMSDWLRSFSSLDKIVRILAFIYRWRCNALVAKELRRLTWLNATEIAMGHRFLMQIIQRTAFKDEIERLSQMYTVSRSSSLCRLSPFIDKEGLVCVGGRLQNSFLTASEKHPIILPSRHHVTTLIIQKAHLVTLHGGPTLVQSHLSR